MEIKFVTPGQRILASEINEQLALLQTYVDSFGNDPNILANLFEKQEKANEYLDQIAQGGSSGGAATTSGNNGVLILNAEEITSGDASNAHLDTIFVKGATTKANSFSIAPATDATFKATPNPNNAEGSFNRHFSLLTVAGTNKTVIQGLAACLGNIDLTNFSTGWRYLKIYNLTSLTVDTDTASYVFPIAAGASRNINLGLGLRFGTGFSIAVSKVGGKTDSGLGVDANDMQININYVTT